MANKKRLILGILIALISGMAATSFVLPQYIFVNEDGLSLVDAISKSGRPPSVQLLINQPTGNNGWHIKPVFVKVKVYYHGARKPGSGEVSLAGHEWYKGAMRVDSDGEFMVIGRATDKNGNTGFARQVIKVDLTPPVVDLNIPDPDGENGYHISNVPVFVTAEDATSGVVFTEINANNVDILDHASSSEMLVSISEENIKEFQHLYKGTYFNESSAKISITESGNYFIDGYIEDEAGNRSMVNADVAIDKDAPMLTIESPQEFKDDIHLFGYAKDFESGIEHVLVDYGEGWEFADVTDGIWRADWAAGELVEGKYPVRAKVKDKAGNETDSEYRATVINTFWPLFAFSALLIAIALFFTLDPRKKEWVELSAEVERHKRMYQNSLALNLEEEYRDD